MNLIHSTPRLLRLLPSSHTLPALRHLATSSHKTPPVDPHPYLSQLNNPHSASSSASSSASGSGGSAGPFPMPDMGGGSREENVRAAGRKWRELKGTEKVGVVATQTWSLAVVLLGAGVAGAVLYSTGTELFATSSPTRIFEDCVERVKESTELKSLLISPYSFHGQSSSNRLRRNRRISSTTYIDPSTSQEILLVRFWVEGTLPPEEGVEEYWFDSVKKWIGPLIWEDSTKPGSYVPKPTHPVPEPVVVIQEEKKRTWSEWIGDGVYSVVGGIVPRLGKKEEGEEKKKKGAASLFTRKNRRPKFGEHNTGEVVAELVKDPTSNRFEYRKLYVEIPDARSVDRFRVNISTDVVGEPSRGLDRLRFWNRTTTSTV